MSHPDQTQLRLEVPFGHVEYQWPKIALSVFSTALQANIDARVDAGSQAVQLQKKHRFQPFEVRAPQTTLATSSCSKVRSGVGIAVLHTPSLANKVQARIFSF